MLKSNRALPKDQMHKEENKVYCMPVNQEPKNRCKAPDCYADHSKHQCSLCLSSNSNHITAKCPEFPTIFHKRSFTTGEVMNVMRKLDTFNFSACLFCVRCSKNVGVLTGNINCKNINVYISDHKGCTEKYGKRNRCKAPMCIHDHTMHICRTCGNTDSNHVSDECKFYR